jgi:sodium-dependent dicarboxylate transporter 2/3/5
MAEHQHLKTPFKPTAGKADGNPASTGVRVKVATADIAASDTRKSFNYVRLTAMLFGIAAFSAAALAPELPAVIDPEGQNIKLSRQGAMALGLFLLAVSWWVFEVIPIGVTSITIGVLQAIFLIRDPRTAFTDFMDPAVWFIIGSITIGTAFSRTGLTNRMAYNMLAIVGERTSRIYLGCFLMTAGLTLFMAHTAVAAALFPLMMAIHHLYTDEEQSRFGKGLFIGMAFTAGAGSIITLFGAARGPVAIGFFSKLVGREITFFELAYYMLPLGLLMVLVLWLYILLIYRPEREIIPGLRFRVAKLRLALGPMSGREKGALLITAVSIIIMSLRQFIPELQAIDKSAIILSSTILFFIFGILRRRDLETLPWNIVLLFGGAMSLGFCLWQTGAANWLAISWLGYLQNASALTFIVGVAAFVLLMTNLIMNVAAITICLPVALLMAPYLGVSPELVLFASLAAAGMPFLFLIGAAPNAIAYESRQFTTAEFFSAGIPASILLILAIALFAWLVWPLMGMPTG